jgi:predicted metal-dependent phosphoesterase TrpH
MSVLLFSLRGVPDDEADEVRELLAAQEIDFYETPTGNWGVSMPALWLRSDDELVKARELLNSYQQQRAVTQRALYLQNKQAGQQQTFWQALRNRPLQYSVYFLAMGLVIYASIRLLFEFGL